MNDTETFAALLKPFPQRSEQMPSVPLIPLPPRRVLSYCSFPPQNFKAFKRRKEERKKQTKEEVPADGEYEHNVNTYGKASKYCNIKKTTETSSEVFTASHRLHFWAVFLLG